MRLFTLMVATAALAFFPKLAMADTACVQTQLSALGFDPGPVDGQLGRRTHGAADVLAGQAGLVLPPLSAETSTAWCTALTEFAATPAAATVFAASEASRKGTPTESTGFASWSWIGERKPYSYLQTTLADTPMDGSFIERFEIRDGDCGRTGSYNDCDHDREHIGWNEEGSTPLNEKVWYSFSMMMPTLDGNMGEINTILAEFRPTGPGQINLSIELQQGELVAVVGSITVEQENDMEPPPIAKWQSLGRLMPGSWYNYELEATWSRDADKGMLTLYRDGVAVMTHKGANTAFNKSVRMQYGLYRPFVSNFDGTVPTQVIYFDNVHKAATRDALGN